VGVEVKNDRRRRTADRGAELAVSWRVEDSLEELAQLARTAGVTVVGRTYQKLAAPHPATFIGPGKVEELQMWKRDLAYDLLIFDEELAPRQLRELEKALDVIVLDRTALILDIFASHARTREGQLQVELAQYEYRLPRLTRMWTHLARQAGGAAGRGGIGGVGLRGPGETQLEIDRRDIRRRIAHLKEELEHVRTHRRQYRPRREIAGIPVVAIVGYTNAGKSTLLNALTAGGDRNGQPQGLLGDHTGSPLRKPVYVADKLFATLDPTTRRVRLPQGREVLFTDTVGFIQKLPHQLVAAFRATLEEINEADLLLHVVDITHRNAQAQNRTVGEVLRELGAADRPMIVALNKIDKLAAISGQGSAVSRQQPALSSSASLTINSAEGSAVSSQWSGISNRFPDCVPISAAEGIGLDALLARIQAVLDRQLVPIRAHLPYNQSSLVALFHAHGIVEEERHDAQGTMIRGRVPEQLVASFREYLR